MAYSAAHRGDLRRRAILSYIGKYAAEHSQSPSVREIGAAVGLRSSNAVAGHLDRLEREGKILRRPGVHRSIQVVDNG